MVKAAPAQFTHSKPPGLIDGTGTAAPAAADPTLSHTHCGAGGGWHCSAGAG